jgi:transmembrane sensor
MRTFESKKQAGINKQLDKLLVEQSSELLEAVQSGDESERRVLAEWLSQSKQHVRTHLFMTALEEELKQLDPERRIPIPDVRGKTLPSRPSPLAWKAKVPSPPPSTRTKRWIWSAAAAVLLSVGAALYGPAVDYFGGWREFKTAVGEQRTVSLSDGSIIQLNTSTRIKARLSTQSRDIRLMDGEALFKVAHDRARPFNVQTLDASIVAVGTQFNVYQLDGRTKVSVLEGRVRVAAVDKPAAVLAAPIVAAGQEVEVRRDGRRVQRAGPDVVNSAAWVQRRVVFKQEPLANVVAQFNRYRKLPQLRIENAELAARKYSGTFDVDDPHSLEDVLANERDVILDWNGNEIVIRGRRQAGGG